MNWRFTKRHIACVEFPDRIGSSLLKLALPVALSLSLVACGGGGSGSIGTGGGDTSSGVDLSPRRYLPLQVGNRWIYQASDSADPIVVRLTDTRNVGGGNGSVVQSSDPTEGESVYLEDANGVRQFPGNGADALTNALGPVQLLHYPLIVGDAFVAADKSLGAVMDFDGDGVLDSASIRADTQVLGLEVLSTPAGQFTDCLHLRTTAVMQVQLSYSKQAATVTTVSDDWLAPGIGPVRTVVTTSGGGTSSTWNQVVTGYGVAGHRSETVAPTASLVTATSGAVLGPQTVLNIAFSETMDPTTTAGAFQVLDVGGKPVVGSVSVTPSGLRFTPTGSWVSGTYSVQLSTSAQDLVGNPLASGQTWPITIDATPPALVQTLPIQGAVNVPLGSAIVLTFSEPVDPASVNASTITLMDSGPRISPLNYAVNGTTVTLTPQLALTRGTSFDLRVNGVMDLVGNAVSGVTMSFTSDPGRFGPPVALLPALPASDEVPGGATIGELTAVGDLDGDGRKDIAATSVQSTVNSWRHNSVLIYSQMTNGSLNAPTQVGSAEDCQTTALQIGDIDADGRNEVILMCAGFGIDVIKPSASGTFLRSRLFNSPGVTQLRLADMDGDGRLDLVTYDYLDNVIRVWLNLPGGWQRVDSPVLPYAPRVSKIAVGDLNGDGRPDVAVAAAAFPNFAAAAVLYQQPGGSFSAPAYLHAKSADYATEVAIADINGDGRPDLLVACLSNGILSYLQSPDGQLSAPSVISSDFFPSALSPVDINGDGRIDVLSFHYQLDVILQQADGSFGQAAQYTGYRGFSQPGSMTAADVNGDGMLDLVSGGLVWYQRPVPVMSQSLPPAGRIAKRGVAARLGMALPLGASR